MKIISRFLCIGFLVSILFSCEESKEKTAVLTVSNSQDNYNFEKLQTAPIQKENSESNNDFKISKIKDFLKKDYLKPNDFKAIKSKQRSFQFQEIDLNNDGANEIFVYLNSSYFCGSGGCTILLLDQNFKLITEFTVIRPPIYVSNSTIGNWKSLYVNSEGKLREIVFKNDSYPSNPSMAPVVNKDSTKHSEIIFENEDQIQSYSF